MEENKDKYDMSGVHTYNCKDMDAAMHKLGDIEKIMDYWIGLNDEYEYSTRMLIGSDNVIIELTIFK